MLQYLFIYTRKYSICCVSMSTMKVVPQKSVVEVSNIRRCRHCARGGLR